jgi:hypothetical protein
MTVDLHFVGLFCHTVLDSGDEFVVAPKGPDDTPHLFRIVVDSRYVDPSTTASYDRSFADPNTPTERCYKSISGVLSISGVATGGSRTTTAAFDAQVPRLTAVSSHRTLSPYITGMTVGGEVKCLIRHPPGAMGVVKSFMEQATFTPPTGGWPVANCIAAISSIVLDTTGGWITVTNGTDKLVLTQTVGTVTFINMPLAFENYHGDFGSFYRAMFSDAAVSESRPVAGGTCPSGYKINTVECSNSQYP